MTSAVHAVRPRNPKTFDLDFDPRFALYSELLHDLDQRTDFHRFFHHLAHLDTEEMLCFLSGVLHQFDLDTDCVNDR